MQLLNKFHILRLKKIERAQHQLCCEIKPYAPLLTSLPLRKIYKLKINQIFTWGETLNFAPLGLIHLRPVVSAISGRGRYLARAFTVVSKKLSLSTGVGPQCWRICRSSDTVAALSVDEKSRQDATRSSKNPTQAPRYGDNEKARRHNQTLVDCAVSLLRLGHKPLSPPNVFNEVTSPRHSVFYEVAPLHIIFPGIEFYSYKSSTDSCAYILEGSLARQTILTSFFTPFCTDV